MNSSATHDTIAALAYDIYVSEGSPSGRHEEHWKEAVSRLSNNAASPAHLPEDKVDEQSTINQPAGDLFHPLAEEGSGHLLPHFSGGENACPEEFCNVLEEREEVTMS